MPKAEATDQGTERRYQSTIEPIAMRVPEACRYLGIGRSTLYILIGNGEIEFIKLGSSTLVLTESLRVSIGVQSGPPIGAQKGPR